LVGYSDFHVPYPKSQSRRRGLTRDSIRSDSWEVGIDEPADERQPRLNCFQELQILADNLRRGIPRQPCNVAAWALQALNKPLAHGITGNNHNDWDCRRSLPRRHDRRVRWHYEDFHLLLHQFSGQRTGALQAPVANPFLNDDALTLDPAEVLEPLPERIAPSLDAGGSG
jgi:hypothetical protein